MVDRRGALTLGDVLAEDSFALELLAGGPAAEQRAVLGAHAVEIERPTRWLAEGWVMLTTGMRLRSRTEAQIALVDEFQAADAAGLGFGIGLAFKQVPSALLDAARNRSFPLFVVPLATNFRDITRFIETSLVGADAQVFHRLTALQRFLIDALSTPEPERAMVERLGRFLGASVVVLDERGKLEVAAGNAPVAELRATVATQPPALFEFDAAGWHAVATPVPAPEWAAPRWLILASRRPGFINKLIKPAATASAPLLAASAQLRDAVRDQDRAVRSALLREALESSESRDLLPLAARVGAFGLDFFQPARVVVIREHPRRRDPQRPTDLELACVQLGGRLEQFAKGYLIAAQGQSVTALAQGDDPTLHAALHDLAHAHPATVIGVGRAVDALHDAHHSLRDAELAADRAGLEPNRRLLLYEDFDLGTFVISEIPPDRLRPWVDDLVAVLRENPPLREAHVAYFEHDLDVTAAAGALHLRPNSLRYRLSRVEELLRRSLRQPSTIANLYIALIADATTKDFRG